METTRQEGNSIASHEADDTSRPLLTSASSGTTPLTASLLENTNKTPSETVKPDSQAKKDNKDNKEVKKKAKAKVIFNVSDTRYDVVRYVGRKLLNYKLTTEPEGDWDVFWTDNAVNPEVLARMQPYQKINHFPGMYSLARKNHLGRNLMRMKRAFPDNYTFFPQTYLLPAEYGEFKAQFAKKNTTFIIKPEASCQGRGIFLTRTWENVQNDEHYVAQRYLTKPFLLDGLKFDLRIYVLLAGSDPLKIYLYDDGLGRFATEEYVAPTASNLENMCMHLTNYAINKDNPNFVFNEAAEDDSKGHKKSLKAVLKMLEEKGHDVKKLWNEIKKIIIKTFCSVQPILAHSYKSCQPDEPYNNMCFEILGFDIILDHKLRPLLLEVNHTPSFTTDTPLDKTIKRGVIGDALKLMNISVNNRIRFKNKKKAEMQQRVLTGKKAKVTQEEKQAAFEKAQAERDEWEAKNLGGYEKIFPFDDPSQAEEDYGEFMKSAHVWWEEWTGTSTKKLAKRHSATEGGKLPPMFFGQGNPAANQTARLKDPQNSSAQKIKLGPLTSNPKVLPNQKQRTPITSEKKHSESLNDIGSTQLKNPDDVQPWSTGVFDVNPLAQYAVIAEDDRDDIMEIPPILEQDSMIESSQKEEIEFIPQDTLRERNVSPSGRNNIQNLKAQQDKVSSASKASSTQVDSMGYSLSNIDHSKSSQFRIKKTNGVLYGRESPNRFTPMTMTADKENSKASFFRSPGTGSTQQKFGTSYLSSGPISSISSLPERSDSLENNLVRRTGSQKNSFKMNSGVIGESTGFEEIGINRVKSSNYLESERTSQHMLKAYQKKVLAALPQQKNPNGNFLTPRVFEMNFQGPKAEPSKQGGTNGGGQLYSGLKAFGRGGKGVLSIKETNNQSAGGLAMNIQEAQMHLQKYNSLYPLDGKR